MRGSIFPIKIFRKKIIKTFYVPSKTVNSVKASSDSRFKCDSSLSKSLLSIFKRLEYKIIMDSQLFPWKILRHRKQFDVGLYFK